MEQLDPDTLITVVLLEIMQSKIAKRGASMRVDDFFFGLQLKLG